MQSYPPNGRNVRVSTTSGMGPRWTADGKTLIYATGDYRIMSATLTVSNGELHAATPLELFQQRHSGRPGNFAADASGERFLMSVSGDDQQAAPITVVLNWPAALLKKK